MEEMFKKILENPSALEQIMKIAQSVNNNEEIKQNEKKETLSLPFGLDNPEILIKLGNAFGKITNDNDPRINLIMAIKPYLNKSRTENADKAMQILKLTKMTSVLEELNIL